MTVACADSTGLLAVRTGTKHAHLYRVDSYAGTSSAIRGYGEVGTSWPAVHTTGYWNALYGPSRW